MRMSELTSCRPEGSWCSCTWPSKMQSFSERSEEHTSELQSLRHLVCRLLLEKKKKRMNPDHINVATAATASRHSVTLPTNLKSERPKLIPENEKKVHLFISPTKTYAMLITIH